MLVTAQQALAAFNDVGRFWRALHFAQSHYVESKLKSPLVYDLETKESYQDLLQIYQRLLLVFPESKKLQRRIQKTKKALSAQRAKDQSDVLEAAQAKVKALVKEDRFDDALQACYQILTYLPEHKMCLRMTETMIKKRDQQINKEIGTFFDKSYDLVKEEYKLKKDSIIRI